MNPTDRSRFVPPRLQFSKGSEFSTDFASHPRGLVVRRCLFSTVQLLCPSISTTYQLFNLYILVTTPAVNTDSLRSLSRICFPNWLHMHMQCMALVPIERRTKSSQWSPMILCTSAYILDCWQRGRRWTYPSRDVRQHCQTDNCSCCWTAAVGL